jgi:uncharacterized membrane protein YcjF (UPF0283 family)
MRARRERFGWRAIVVSAVAVMAVCLGASRVRHWRQRLRLRRLAAERADTAELATAADAMTNEGTPTGPAPEVESEILGLEPP